MINASGDGGCGRGGNASNDASSRNDEISATSDGGDTSGSDVLTLTLFY